MRLQTTLPLFFLILKHGQSFLSRTTTGSRQQSKLGMFFADELPDKKTSPPTETKTEEKIEVPQVDIVSSDNERFINMAGSFLVDNFWLSSRHHNIKGEITREMRMSLIVEQCADLQEKYGEILGKRLLKSCVLGALEKETKEMVGVVTLRGSLLINDEVLESERAEVIAKNAISSLGPKQRREYKDASMSTIATELLSPDSKAIVGKCIGENVLNSLFSFFFLLTVVIASFSALKSRHKCPEKKKRDCKNSL